MPNLFNQSLTPEELAERVGRMDQVAGARPFVFDEGPARGMRGIDVWTGSGLVFTVLPDRCLDIGSARLGGRPFGWESSTGPVAPERFDAEGFRWLRSFHGGLLTTCGLRHFGAPDADDGEAWGLHGRASHLSAEKVGVECAWHGDTYRIRIRGHVREAEVFKPTLVLERTITTALGSRTIEIADRVTNAGYARSAAMLLYHVNLGWPLVSETSRLLVDVKSISGMTDFAESNVATHREFQPPTEGIEEMCYQIVPKAGDDGLGRAAIVNPTLDGGFGVSVTWTLETLPQMAEWKMMGQGTYVVGVEPMNCPFPPRDALRAKGAMPELEPGESFETAVTLSVHLGAEELADLEESIPGG
ncbi:MAG TPA: aldose 1-epimerase family protein [Phycisphaerae bacterium]|nr:aldose 1-epimerase family protein [Phycisphaerae bacterium]